MLFLNIIRLFDNTFFENCIIGKEKSRNNLKGQFFHFVFLKHKFSKCFFSESFMKMKKKVSRHASSRKKSFDLISGSYSAVS